MTGKTAAELLRIVIASVALMCGFGGIGLTSIARADGPTTAPSAAPAGFAGEWQTTFGTMRLTQAGDKIQGTYGSGGPSARISGTLSGRKWTFTYTEPNATGDGWFELAADGKSFAGQWRETGSKNWAAWEGKRVADAVASAGPFDGLWASSYGRMRLHQTGDDVRGIYAFAGTSKITGKVTGRTFAFKYEQPDGETGEGKFELSADGTSFKGTWKPTTPATGTKLPEGQLPSLVWEAKKIEPTPGIVWLVVVEAPWEQNLTEQEYSFGAMLRAFFTRVPNVQVRHRFFTDEPQFRKWLGELPYIAEPVVLHISSHGNKQGVTPGGKVIGADVMAECLKEAGDLKLVHFGSCLVCAGDVPKKIFEAIGPDARFAISGYTKEADWAGSAVVDFTYLELVLARGVAPAQAVKQTQKMLTFAGDQPTGAPIPPTGLVVFEPPPKR